MTEPRAALLRLRLAESRLKRAHDLALVVEKEPAKLSLFVATTRDLPKVRENFDSDFIAVQLAIDDLPDVDANKFAETMVDFEEKYFFVMEKVDALTDKSKGPMIATASTKVHHSKVSLPKITLPNFSGDCRQWPNFSNLFITLVAENAELSAVEKLAYLKGALQGEPLGMIQSLSMSEANFDVAWALLEERYENKRLIVNVHVEALLHAPSASSATPNSLRRLLCVITENVSALKALDIPVEQWDLMLLPILCKCLDAHLQTQWELTLSRDLPTLAEFISFLERYCRAQETVDSGASKVGGTHPAKSKPSYTTPPWRQPRNDSGKQLSRCLVSATEEGCVLCKGPHKLSNCKKFGGLSPRQRYSAVKDHNLCLNCFSQKHRSRGCPLSISCQRCGGRHHTLLHFESEETEKGSSSSQTDSGSSRATDPRQTTTLSAVTPVRSVVSPVVLLSTAQLHIIDCKGTPHVARALLDTASQASFISEHCCQRLGLVRKKTHLPIQGLSNATVNVAKSYSSVVVTPRGMPDVQFALDVFIIPHITSKLPSVQLSREVRHSVAHLTLADPEFDVPQPIDLLIGADLVPHLLTGGKLTGTPMALDSIFGWILMGKVEAELPTVPSASYCISLLTMSPLEEILKQFWELEEFPPVTHKSVDEVHCEKLFVETHKREPTGRYTVSLPFHSLAPELGASRPQAMNRLLRLERRFERDLSLKQRYSEFMRDYLEEGHMERVPVSELVSSPSYYIPHHCVIKAESTTTKLRVVFDASSKSSSGMSLNDILLTGPRLQQDIIDVLTKVRLHAIVFTADIKQMYRQIAICREHQDFQRIVWRFDNNGVVEDYRLKTVTYGVSSAPYLALRTLQQLAEDEKERFPRASKVLKSEVYVDDVVTGSNSVESALSLQKELISLLTAGGFKLRKFVSNHPALVDWLPAEDVEVPEILSLDQDSRVVKVLGLQWNPNVDCFSYKIQPSCKEATKRNILSEIARIFDPLGWLSPLSMFSKCLIQTLWLEKLDWDAEPPHGIVEKWTQFNNELPLLASVAIPRQIVGPAGSSYQLHGFSDSSEVGYAAVVYLRVAMSNKITTHLVAGKSKVSPVKVQSIPRLELCGALLLARLLHHLVELFTPLITLSSITAWTDSQIVLCWVNSSPHHLKTFVANRVSEVQELTRTDWWRHVPSESNPADCASRGLLPSQLVGHPLWWTGPAWLQASPHQWPSNSQMQIVDPVLLEQKVKVLGTFVSPDCFEILLTRFSGLTRLLRVVSLVLRFIHNCRNTRTTRLTVPLTPRELDQSLDVLIVKVQSVMFKEELASVRNGRLVSPQLRKLVPFVDTAGLLRVGGRLQHSDLPFDHKHPVLLPKNHVLTDLIIGHYHEVNQHPGVHTLRSILRERFWIVSDKQAIARRLRYCIRCWKARPSSCSPLMGNLPAMRVQQVKPFARAGVDYAGPIQIKASRMRKSPVLKAYLCIFVCCATKAVHVEVASDLSTDVFLAAYKRFVSRRGRSSDIYSDCGTNFVGAHNYLRELQQLLASSSHRQRIVESFAPLGVTWHFNPPAAPHFGGLWEAGVKSFKTHLVRVIGEQVLTFEELYTVVVQVEAVLNSRPLCPLTSDPNDLVALTPGHFLTLEPLVAVPDHNVRDVSLNRLQRWQLVERLHQDFWQRWHREYLHTLQQRLKWLDPGSSITPNQLVAIKDERLPPLQWRLARVEKLHPGSDGISRVATVRTANGAVKRPLVKLCPLPEKC